MYLLMKQKNVIYPYHYEDGQTTALFMAHTDTVFPDMEPMGVREEEDKMFSPGVGDDTANVAILLMMAKYIATQTGNQRKSDPGG